MQTLNGVAATAAGRPLGLGPLLALGAAITAAGCGGTASMIRADPPPPTTVEPVSDTLHGEVIVDPYRWLEDGESERTAAWTTAQNAHTERYMAATAGRDALSAQLAAAFQVGWVQAPDVAGDQAFWLEQRGQTDQPLLMIREVDARRPARVLLDVNTLSDDGTTALDWTYPSPTGRLMAYGLSRSGDERSVLHVMDTRTGEPVGETIEGARAASLAWLPDESGFYYTRYPLAQTRYWPEVSDEDASYYRHVYLHVLGTDPAQDVRLFGEGRDREEWANVLASPDGRWLVVVAFKGWSNSTVYARRADAPADAPWHTVADRAESLEQPLLANRWLYLHTNHEAARGRVVRIPWEEISAPAWAEVVPEARDGVLRDVALSGDRLVLHHLFQASSRLSVTTADGASLGQIPLPTLGSVSGIGANTRHRDIFVAFSSFTTAPSVLRVTPDALDAPTVFTRIKGAVDPEQFTVALHHTRSADGTEVSLFVAHHKDLPKDGDAPTVLYGYGGFDVALTPDYNRNIQPFLAAGGVYAVAHLRGGGEYGAEWHKAGMLGNKERVFEDFEACATYLVQAGFTRPERLAVMGGSNGGLLTGAAVVRFPKRFRAAVVRVPLLDMVRYPLFLIAKLWIPEYGDPADPEAFRWLHAYSPYHHVPEHFDAPAVLLMAAESDTRVDPLHARKFAALLQAHNTGPHPVLLRIETKAGHGAGKPRSKVVEEYLDIWSFLWRELGMKSAMAPAASPPG